MADVVYVLCALTSVACAVLLLRGYRSSGVSLTLWTGLCFVGLAFNNVLLIVDLAVLPTSPDLKIFRIMIELAAVGLLLYGMITAEPRRGAPAHGSGRTPEPREVPA